MPHHFKTNTMRSRKYKPAKSRAVRLLQSALLFTMLLTAASCKKFLATYSQNNTFIQSVSDLRELMVGEVYTGTAGITPPQWVHILDDDTEENPPASYINEPVLNLASMHRWQKNPWIASAGIPLDDIYFLKQYRRIAAINTILENITVVKGKGGSEIELERIAGEAHFMRALIYLQVNNLYGKPYRESTAGVDLSIPLKTNAAVEDRLFKRATVKELYEQIVNDLLSGEKEMAGAPQQLNTYATQAAAQLLLSRVYLYMGKYEKAINWADKAIVQKRYAMLDLNKLPADGAFMSKASSETIFTYPNKNLQTTLMELTKPSKGGIVGGDNFKASRELLNSYTDKDLRKHYIFQQAGSNEWLPRKGGKVNDVVEETIMRFPEAFLNKAEALAVLGRSSEAADAVQQLRKNRFKPEDLTAITETGEALVNFIRDERRRELCFEMHRWSDLRRYSLNVEYPLSKVIRHPAYGSGSSGTYLQGYYELRPYTEEQAAWIIPIPLAEIEYNKGELFNYDRPDRPLKQ